MSKNFTYDANGFKVYEGHGETDLSFLDKPVALKLGKGEKINNAHEDSAFAVSPELSAAKAPKDFRDDFESLCDMA